MYMFFLRGGGVTAIVDFLWRKQQLHKEVMYQSAWFMPGVPSIMLASSGNEFLLSNDIVLQFIPESTLWLWFVEKNFSWIPDVTFCCLRSWLPGGIWLLLNYAVSPYFLCLVVLLFYVAFYNTVEIILRMRSWLNEN